MESQSSKFLYFPLLPTEIRLLIWELRLPCRMAEYDPSWELLYGTHLRLACYSNCTARRDSELRSIAVINREARAVVLRHGWWLERTPENMPASNEDDEFSPFVWLSMKQYELPVIPSLWVQPAHDTLIHCNSIGSGIAP